MHRHALNQAITLYRGETLTIDQAARHAGVTITRMERALRSRSVPVRASLDSPTPAEASEPDPVAETVGGQGSIDPFENPSAGAD